MQSVKIYPAELGVSGWLETSTYKNHQFNHEDEILDEYDYVVVGAGYGGLELQHGSRNSIRMRK